MFGTELKFNVLQEANQGQRNGQTHDQISLSSLLYVQPNYADVEDNLETFWK